MSKLNLHLSKLLVLAARHGFLVERSMEKGFSVYEYGPLGTELRRNLRQLWWKDVVLYKDNVNGLESSMFDPDNESTSTKYEITSPMENNSKLLHKHHQSTIKHYHLPDLDKLVSEVLSHLENQDNIKTVRRNDLKELILRNTIRVKTRNHLYSEGLDMLCKTLLPADSQMSLPQGWAWNRKYLQDMDNDDDNFLRNIEEELLCLKYIVEARTAKYWLNFWKRERLIWWRKFASVPSNFSSFEVQQNSQAHFSTEIQYAFPWGNEPIETIDYWPDLNPHPRVVSDVTSRTHPHILQVSTSLDKGFVALLVDAFEENQRANTNGNVSTRNVLCLHPSLAPTKVAILSQNKERNELSEVSRQLALELCHAGIYTSSQWNGRPLEEMYAYNDEIATPYCITILESTLSNGVVILRNRDTTLQEFVHISDVLKTLQSHLKMY